MPSALLAILTGSLIASADPASKELASPAPPPAAPEAAASPTAPPTAGPSVEQSSIRVQLAHQADSLTEVIYEPDGRFTPAVFHADLDQDGELEEITVGWTDEVEVLLSVREPALQGAAQVINLGQAFDFDGPLDVISTRPTTPAETGISLVYVNWGGREMCGSGDWSRYASYRSSGPGTPGVLREALVHSGSGSDSPVFWESTATFLPAEQAFELHRRSGEYGDAGQDDFITEDSLTRYALKDGVFVEVSRTTKVDRQLEP